MIDQRELIAETEKQSIISLIDSLREARVVDNEVIEDDSDVNQDLYEIGILGNEATLEEVIFKINEIVTYLNKNLGV